MAFPQVASPKMAFSEMAFPEMAFPEMAFPEKIIPVPLTSKGSQTFPEKIKKHTYPFLQWDERIRKDKTWEEPPGKR